MSAATMEKFAVGQRVRCVKSGGGSVDPVTDGLEYTITAVRDSYGEQFVTLKDKGVDFWADRFVAIDEPGDASRPLGVGDRVVVESAVYSVDYATEPYGIGVGLEGTVSDATPDYDNDILVEFDGEVGTRYIAVDAVLRVDDLDAIAAMRSAEPAVVVDTEPETKDWHDFDVKVEDCPVGTRIRVKEGVEPKFKNYGASEAKPWFGGGPRGAGVVVARGDAPVGQVRVQWDDTPANKGYALSGTYYIDPSCIEVEPEVQVVMAESITVAPIVTPVAAKRPGDITFKITRKRVQTVDTAMTLPTLMEELPSLDWPTILRASDMAEAIREAIGDASYYDDLLASLSGLGFDYGHTDLSAMVEEV